MPRVSAWSAVKPRTSSPESTAARFESGGRIKTKMKEASDVVALPGGRVLAVGDRSDSVVVIDEKGKRTELKLDGLKDGKSQLEGVTYNPLKKLLFVAREEKGEILRYKWDALTNEKPVLDKTFSVASDANKGVEGLSYLPGEFSPTQTPKLVLAKEGSPSQIFLIDDGGDPKKGNPIEIQLEKEIHQACRDFSGVTVDPKTGNLFICSDESSACAQIKLVRDGDKIRGKLVQAFPLRDDNDEPLKRVEGLCFNAKGDLFILTENDGELRHLKRK